MKTLHLAPLCFIALFAYCAVAQNAPQPAGTPEPPPSPPLIAAKVPPWCQWTVDYTYSATGKGASPGAPRPLHVTVVQTGDIRGEVRNLERGFVDERWTMGDAVVEKTPDRVQLVVTLDGPATNGEFPEFNWISTTNFTGRKKLNGIDCLIFKDKIDPTRISHPEHPPSGLAAFVEATAYVAEETRLPVGLEMPTEARRFTFLPAPTALLVPPPAFVAAAQELRNRVNASTTSLSPP